MIIFGKCIEKVKIPTTKSTFEGSFSGMSPRMSDHVAVMSESFTTMVALEGLIPRVGPHVLLESPRCAELLSAQLAPTGRAKHG